MGQPKPSPKAKEQQQPKYIVSDATVADIQRQYLATVREIQQFVAEYSRTAAPEGTMGLYALFAAARDDVNISQDAKLKSLVEEYDSLTSQANAARKAAAERAAELLGVTMHYTPPKPDESLVARLKEERKAAIQKGKLLTEMSKWVPGTAETISAFLAEYPMPNLSGTSSVDLTSDGASGTPKHRVDVSAQIDGKELLTGTAGRGFTNAVNAIRKTRIYPRGSSPDQEYFRKRWEDREAGTSAVTWTDDTVGITYTVRARS